MSEWPLIALGELIHVKHGYAFKGDHFSESGTDLILTPGNFKVGGGLQIRPGKEKYYSASYPAEFELRPDDLLVVMTDLKQDAPILGSPAVVPGDGTYLHNQRLGLVTVTRPERLCERFLYWLLVADQTRAQLRATATGATVRHTAPERIYKAHVPLPIPAVQRRVAGILDAIDDLIENNRRRIALLEQMAQAIYREWFVRFRYPGHEGDELVDSPLGPIPVGWEPADVADVCAYLSRGIAPKYADDGESLVINQRCIRNGRLDLGQARRQARSIPADKLIRHGDVLINSTGEGTLGRIAQVDGEIANATVDTHVTIARPLNDVGRDWFGLTLLARQRDFEALSVGSTGQTELGRTAIGSAPVAVPPHTLRAAFGDRVSPLRRLSAVLSRKRDALTTLRDLLLPKLVTGAIDVSHLDLDGLLADDVPA